MKPNYYYTQIKFGGEKEGWKPMEQNVKKKGYKKKRKKNSKKKGKGRMYP